MQNLPSGKATWLWKLPFLVDLPVKKKKLSWFTKRVRTYTVHEHYVYIYIYICLVFSAGYHTSPSKVETTFFVGDSNGKL